MSKVYRKGSFTVKKPCGLNFGKKENFDEFMTSLKLPFIMEDNVYIYNNVAIEYCNLLDWCDQKVKKGDLTKRSESFSKKGIRSLHIFNDEWYNRTEIVKSIIKVALGFHERKLYARACELKYLSKQEEKEFFNKNHLQGFSSSQYCLGLVYHGEIVSAISMSRPRFSKETDWELIRYACKLNTTILGGFERLLKKFRSEHPGSITTYSDRRLFSGNLYRKLFKELTPTLEDYYYTEGTVRENRIKFQKYKLVSAFPEWENDVEYVIANRIGWYRVWGCGNWKFKIG